MNYSLVGGPWVAYLSPHFVSSWGTFFLNCAFPGNGFKEALESKEDVTIILSFSQGWTIS